MTTKELLFLIVCLDSSAGTVHAQRQLTLQHRWKSQRTKVIKLDRIFQIQTADTAYFSNIIGFTDSTILIPIRTPTGKDSVYVRSYHYQKYSKNSPGFGKDTTIVNRTVVPLYRSDTLVIAFTEILWLKKDWFNDTRWLEPFGWVLAGSILGVAMLPVAAIDEGAEGVRNWASFEAVLLAVALPPIFIGSRRTKYDLKKKWKLMTR